MCLTTYEALPPDEHGRGPAGADPPGPWILVLIRDDDARARLESAMRSRARIVAVESTRAAEQVLAAASSRPTAAVLSATDAGGRNCLPLVRKLTQLRPAVPVIGYCSAEGIASRDVVTLVRAGVHDVMFRGIDDQGRAVRRFVDTAATTCGVDEILRTVTPGLHPALLPFVRYCLAHPRPGSVSHSCWAGESIARSIHSGFIWIDRSAERKASRSRSRTSRGASSSWTMSRLCASTRPVASRMSPRGAGSARDERCCRAARACQVRPCSSSTRAAWIAMASAKIASSA